MKGCFAVLVLLGLLVNTYASIRILSFNIRQFGHTKYGKQDVVDTLVKIVENYDLIFVIEIVDSTTTLVLPGFVKQLNSSVEDQGFVFDYVVSDRVGRTNIKEQYGVIYRTNVVKVIDTFQYEDIDDIFQRPPFSVYIEAINQQNGVLPPFFLIVIHTQPSDTANEIDGLLDVYDSAVNYFSTSAGMILGDLNADCSYLSNTKYNNLRLFVNTSFTWWIDKNADTTSKATTDCAYDRIITSSSLTPYVVNNSVDIIKFDEEYGFSSDFTADVSDHYPVSITLEGCNCHLGRSVAAISRGSMILWTVNLMFVFTATVTMF